MMRNRAQGQGYDVKSVLIPEAYEALITQNEARWEAGQFYRYEGPLASYNDLIIFAHPVPDAKERGVKKTGRSSLTGDPMWLIWDKSRKDGFLRLTPELFRQASNYAAWYRRVEGKAISCLELFDLLIEQKSVGGILSFYKVITPTSLKDKAEKVLSIEAFVTYLGLVAGKSEFKPDEARRYFGMLDQAARLLAAEGFIMTDYDVKELVCEAKPDPPEQGTWEKVAEAIPFTATLPKSIRDTSAMWDSLNEGEKARMNQAVEKLIEKKKKLRAEAREQFWTDRTRGVAAGLALEDVKIVIEHSLDGKDVSASSSSLEAPNGEEFTLQWTATLPEQAEDTAAYVCSISIAGFDKSGSALSREIKIAPQVEKPPEEKVGQTPGVQGTDYGKPALPPCPPEVACPIPMGAKHEWSGDREYYTLNGKKVGVEKYWNKSHTVVLNENGYTEDQENPRYSRHYYENGQLASSIWFKGKDRHGRELAFHKNGKKRAEAIWIDDNQVAYWRWSENGNPESEGIQYDKRSWTKCYHPNGKPYSEENRVLVENHFVKHGKQTYWHENGQKMSEDYYKHDKMNGKSVMWNDQGIKTRDKEYKEDQLHGRSTAWSEKGVIQFVCDYKDGKEHGVQQRYDMEGKLRYEENYREGQKHGKDTTYYPSGKVQYESYYKDGKLEGPYFFYSEDGQPIVEGNYADGKKQGEFRRFNKSGKIINVEIYDKDMLIETRAF
jgi:antitoxin component YwqK of YwqJK toxin-antitoxin module